MVFLVSIGLVLITGFALESYAAISENIRSDNGYIVVSEVVQAHASISYQVISGCKDDANHELIFHGLYPSTVNLSTLHPCDKIDRTRREDGGGDSSSSPSTATSTTTLIVTTSVPSGSSSSSISMQSTTAPHPVSINQGFHQCDMTSYHVAGPPKSGLYRLLLAKCSNSSTDSKYTEFNATIWIRNSYGYLPYELYGLLVFYGVLGLLYLALGLIWATALALHYKDLLHLQFWIGAVIALGMFEMSFSYGQYEYFNDHGEQSMGLLVFAQLLRASKNTLARILILIVSMGFGIVKPRLGSAVKQIAALSCSYFFFAAAYFVSSAKAKDDMFDDPDGNGSADKTRVMVIIPLSVLDAAFFWWIFLSLSHTIKVLNIRYNEAKLKVYTRFQHCLILTVIAGVSFAIWDMYASQKRATDEWQYVWLFEAYWEMLFFVILMVIMYLWRPSMNSVRFATALIDNGDDEEEAGVQIRPAPHSFEEIKMRLIPSTTDRPVSRAPKDDLEEDLKWVEEHIPSTHIPNDNTFPNFAMDSDEEIMHTRFEMSKMR